MLTSVCKHIESMSPLWVKKILRRRSLCSGGTMVQLARPSRASRVIRDSTRSPPPTVECQYRARCSLLLERSLVPA